MAVNASETRPFASVVVDLYLSPTLTRVPISSPVAINCSLNSIVAILAFSIDFQSINLTEPEDKAWAKLYIAREASLAFAPETAASFEIPLIAMTASSSLTPALVNFPMFCVMSENEYMVLSEYSLSSSRYLLTVSMDSPVEDIIVLTEFVFNSYSEKPAVIGSIANAFTIFFPASTAELVMLAKAVTPTTCSAENLAATASTPLAVPSRCNAVLSLSSVLMVSFAFRSKFLFWNCISTTRLSISSLI